MSPKTPQTDVDLFEELLNDALVTTGVEIAETPHEIALYMAERSLHLAAISHEPGFARAVRAEANSVALRAGLNVADDAAAGDQFIRGVVQGALAFAAGRLA